MPRVTRSTARKLDRPSGLQIFLRRQRKMVRPAGALIGVAVLLGGGAWAVHALGPGGRLAPLRERVGQVAHLRVTDIVVQGRAMTSDASLAKALGIAKGDDIMAFQVDAARQRIDALPFVEHATVQRRLPGTILVTLVERRPFAVWQNQGKFVLIGRDGAVVAGQGMNGKDAEAFAALPLVVGAGAPQAAAPLLDLLHSMPQIEQHVLAAVRVSERRWNLSLRNGTDVLLPEGHEDAALKRLAEYEQRFALLDRPMAAIDMRLPDRLVVRPLPAPPADAAAPGNAAAPGEPGKPEPADPSAGASTHPAVPGVQAHGALEPSDAPLRRPA